MKAVAARGHMTEAGYRPENNSHRNTLIDPNGNGRDPMQIPPAQLTEAGHPRASCANVISRLRVMHGTDRGEARGDDFLGIPRTELPRRLTQIRDTICRACTGERTGWAEIKRCDIYDCPAWPYRMGRNPHNPQRGRPFPSR